jgi:hypothetical protein
MARAEKEKFWGQPFSERIRFERADIVVYMYTSY